MADISIQQPEEGPESLALAIQALLRWSGASLSYGTINAALGLSFTATAPRRPECVAWWEAHGREATLEPTAAALGLTLRNLHPPQAGLGLDDSPEFLQHFEASYRPLILNSLTHNQPVLVRGGWPGDRAKLWGIVTTPSAGSIGLAGKVPTAGDRLLDLERPPVQMYVVEEFTPRSLPPADLLGLAASNGLTLLGNRPGGDHVLTGPATYKQWLEQVGREFYCHHCKAPSPECHRRRAAHLAANRAAAAAFLRASVDAAPESVQETIHAAVDLCRQASQALTHISAALSAEDSPAPPADPSTIAVSATAAQQADRRLFELLAESALLRQ